MQPCTRAASANADVPEPVDAPRNMLQIYRKTTGTMTNSAMKKRVGCEVRARRRAVIDLDTPTHSQPLPGGLPREDR